MRAAPLLLVSALVLVLVVLWALIGLVVYLVYSSFS